MDSMYRVACDTHFLKLPHGQHEINLIKGFCKVQVYHVDILAIL